MFAHRKHNTLVMPIAHTYIHTFAHRTCVLAVAWCVEGCVPVHRCASMCAMFTGVSFRLLQSSTFCISQIWVSACMYRSSEMHILRWVRRTCKFSPNLPPANMYTHQLWVTCTHTPRPVSCPHGWASNNVYRTCCLPN